MGRVQTVRACVILSGKEPVAVFHPVPVVVVPMVRACKMVLAFATRDFREMIAARVLFAMEMGWTIVVGVCATMAGLV